jgi:hypothetical protein
MVEMSDAVENTHSSIFSGKQCWQCRAGVSETQTTWPLQGCEQVQVVRDAAPAVLLSSHAKKALHNSSTIIPAQSPHLP